MLTQYMTTVLNDSSASHWLKHTLVDAIRRDASDAPVDAEILSQLFAVPWRALTLDTRNDRFTLSIAKDALTNAPGFDKGTTGRPWQTAHGAVACSPAQYRAHLLQLRMEE